MTLFPYSRHGRNQHFLAFQIPSVSKDVCKYSFFSETIRDWNDLPESLISSSDLSDDSVSTFTSLVRVRDYFPPVTAPGEGWSVWRFTSIIYRFILISCMFSSCFFIYMSTLLELYDTLKSERLNIFSNMFQKEFLISSENLINKNGITRRIIACIYWLYFQAH